MSQQPVDALDVQTGLTESFNDQAAPTDLTTIVPALQRMLSVPGEFATDFPNTATSDLANSLADGFAEAQLDGFFSKQVVDPNALTVTPGLSSGGMALVVLYSGIRILKARLRTIKTTVKYEAAGVVYDVSQSANVLATELKEMADRKTQLLGLVLRQYRARSAVRIMDGYILRSQGYYPFNYYGEFGSFYGYELLGYGGLLLNEI